MSDGVPRHTGLCGMMNMRLFLQKRIGNGVEDTEAIVNEYEGDG